MPSRILQDDRGNESSMRLVFVIFMITTLILIGVVMGMIVNEYLSNGDRIGEFNTILGYLTGGGLSGFFAKAFQKKYEKEKEEAQVSPPIPSSPPQDNFTPTQDDYTIVIDRFYENEHKTLSNCGVWNGREYVYSFKGIELPWRNNMRNISRIPSGLYDAKAILKGRSGYYGIHILNVPNRSEIMIHIANYVRQLEGCIAPGNKFKDIDNDGIIDVKNSKDAIDEIARFIPLWSNTKVLIRDAFTNIRPI